MNITALHNRYYENAGGNNSTNLLISANAMFCVIRYFLLRWVPSLVLTLSCSRKFSCNFYHDMLDQMFRLWDYPDKLIQIVVLNQQSGKYVGGSRHRNILLVDSYQTFLDANIISFTSGHDYNEYNYIILHIPDDLLMQHMQQILDYCWTHYIIRCSVQVQNKRGEIVVYSYYPFTAEHCGKVVPVIVNRYNGTYFEVPKLFPIKLHNLHQCPLRAALFDAPPFLHLSTNGNKTIISGGFEGKMILQLAALLNFTIDVIIPPNDEERGQILGNTTTGALKMLSDRTADFSLGGFRQSIERDQVASYTTNHFQSKEVFVILSAAYDLSSWQILVFPFKTSTWLLIIFILSLIALRAFIAKRLFLLCSTYFHHYYPKNCYIDIFSTLIGLPASTMPCTIKVQILFVIWLYFTLVIRTVYQGLIFHQIITRVENDIPKSFEQLLESNFTAVMIKGTGEESYNKPFIGRMQKVVLNTTNKVEPFSYIEENKSQKLVVVTAREYLYKYAQTKKKPGVFKIVPQHLFTFSTTIYMTKHSFLIEQFNEEILWMSVAGLVEFWRRELNPYYYRGANLQRNNVYGMNELHMIFVVYGVGLIIACLVFFLETISKRYKFLERFFRNA